MSLGGESPDMLSPPAMMPDSDSLAAQLTEQGLTPCDCVATRGYTVTLKATQAEVNDQQQQIQTALNNAWKEKNPGSSSYLKFLLYVLSTTIL